MTDFGKGTIDKFRWIFTEPIDREKIVSRGCAQGNDRFLRQISILITEHRREIT